MTISFTPDAAESTQRRYISQATAAELGEVSTRTIRRMIAAGILPATRVGDRLLRIDIRDFDRVFGGGA